MPRRAFSPLTLAATSLILLLLAGKALAAMIVNEHSGNPIFGQGVGGPRAYYPSVLYDGSSFSGHGHAAPYKMWYGTSSQRTGLATSNDGLTWTDQGVVTMPTPGYHATVEYYPAGFAGAGSGGNPSSSTMYYRMWFWPGVITYSVNDIRYAESADGFTWFNDQPLQNGAVPIVTGNSPDWNRGSYGPCDVLYNPGASNSGTDWTFTLYYDGTTGGTESIGLAFSADGIAWTGYDADSDGDADPVLTGTFVAGDWDYDYVSRATIIKTGSASYEMWYSGGTGTINHGIGHATSSDGIHWTRDPANLILHRDDTGYPGQPWRSNRTYCPAVIQANSVYKMWFAGRSPSGNYAIGYATLVIPPPPTPKTPSAPRPVIQVSDPAISKTVSPLNAAIGETVIWMVEVSNPGTTQTDNFVFVRDSIPDMFDIVNVSTTRGAVTVEGQEVQVEIGVLHPGERVTITIETVANALAQPGQTCNTASADWNFTFTDAACITFFPGELPPTGGRPVRDFPWLALGGGLIALTLGGLALLKKRQPA